MTTTTELGTWMLEAAEIGYWAEAHFEGDTLIITGDGEGTDTTWPVRITPTRMAHAHRALILKGEGIKNVHPSNYGWIQDGDDYDADSTDWVVQHLCFGEVIYG